MLAKMFLFEWRYYTRQPSFYVTSLIFFLLTFFATVSENVQLGGGGNVTYNGPFSIAQTALILGVFAMFLVVNFVANTAIRNDESKMAEILYSKPISPFAYQLGRFLGAYAITLTVFAFVPLGTLVGVLLGGAVGWVDAERLGPHVFSHYITTFIYLSVPTLFVLSCIFYAVANKFRTLMATYLSAVALFILYIVGGRLASDPEFRTLVALLDPFALRTFADMTRYWTMFDKNNSAIELTGVLLHNRMIWLSVGVAILALLGGLMSAPKLSTGKSSKKSKADKHDQDLAAIEGLMQNNIKTRSAGITTLPHLVTRTLFEVKQVVFSAPFLILAALTMFMLIAPLVDPRGWYGTPNWPLTQTMVTLVSEVMQTFLMIVVVYYSAEIVWRERNSGMGDIVDSMPVKNLTFWFSKLTAMLLVIALLFVFGMVVTVLNQIIRGHGELEVSQYIVRLGYVNLLPWFMTAILAFFLQVLSPNKYIGMLLTVLFFIVSITLANFGFSHFMWQFGAAPRVQYSDINGYGHFMTAHNWYMLYWGALSVILSALGYALWHRGPQQSLKARVQKLGYYLGASGKASVAIAALIFVASGSYIYYNTRVLNEFVVADDRLDLQAEYEKQFVAHKDDVIPTITAVKAYVDIYPEQRKITARSEFNFVNQSEYPITRFLISVPQHTSQWQLQLAGGEVVEQVEKFNSAWFEFSDPLQPGESRSGEVSVVRAHNGYKNSGEDFSLVENGTFINNYDLFPAFGYNASWEISERHERRKRDLKPQQRANKLEETHYHDQSFFGAGVGFIDFEAVISTSEDQFAIAPGYLQSKTVENGRRTYHYKMDAPMKHFYSIMSAKLEKQAEVYKGINIEVYHHASHNKNVATMIESVKDSIDYFSANFGPYQHKQMRIIEFPGYRSFAQSFANTVPYSEQIGFITDTRDPEDIDVPYYVTAHEVAHQWWGHQVGAADVQGSQIIIESLSQYSAMMVMEKKYGPEKLRKFLKYELDRYLRGRSTEAEEEMPLLRSEGQQYIHYQKGSVVMMSLRDRLGEERFNQALRAFADQYKYKSDPYPTTLDLMAAIEAVADEREQVFISHLFEHISIYDLKTTEIAVKETEQGEFEVTLTVEAKLSHADGHGHETEVALDEMVDIGLFSADPEDLTQQDTVLYLQKHPIKAGINTITLTSKTKPKFAGVDPFVKLVDRDSGDNIKKL